MLPKKMLEWGTQRSIIREIFEEGKEMKKRLGESIVYDFSIGNPSIEPPKVFNESLIKLLSSENTTQIHGYTSNSGDIEARMCIANYLSSTYSCSEKWERVYMTCGATASLAITLHALINPGDEVVLIAPYFIEYTVFAEKAGAKLKIAECKREDMQLDVPEIEKVITENTKAIIVNSPNNPSGVVYSESAIKELGKLLEKKEKEYSHPIYVISDEPYRELIYDGIKYPYIPSYIKNTISCYSFSKALSIPGERIGYICVTEKCEDGDNIFAGIQGAGRALGYVCAPSLYQKVIPYIIGTTVDVSIYDANRKLIYDIVTKAGFEALYPQGAFYLFVKNPDKDGKAFFETAKKYHILFVPSEQFGVEGYVRVAYCLDAKKIEDSRENWIELGKEYFGK